MVSFRKGDTVSISCIIESTFGDGDFRPRMLGEGGYIDIFAKQSDMKMVRPDFRVGDMVTWSVGDSSFTGHVLSIASDHLWVDRGGGEFATVWAFNATRVDPVPEPVAEAVEPPPAPHMPDTLEAE